jgi:hypothetical protein
MPPAELDEVSLLAIADVKEVRSRRIKAAKYYPPLSQLLDELL